MAVSPLNAFTDLENFLLAGQAFAQVAAIPTAGSPTTLLFTCLGLPMMLLLSQAAASPTGCSVTAGSNQLTVGSAAGIVVGQLVYSATAGTFAPGTTVAAISGTTITLSQNALGTLASATVNFITAVTNATGIAVTATFPLPLVIGSNTFISYISYAGGYPSYGGYPGSGLSSLVNVAAGS
jgi:hypothetical protein